MNTKPIGGYFEWEFPVLKDFTLHDKAVLVNSGKHALEFVLRTLPNIKRIWIPFFTCIDVLYPIKRLGITYKFYHIDHNLEILQDSIELQDGDYVLCTNYYGIKDQYIKSLFDVYGDCLIVDNAHALFCKSNLSIHQIYSPRKFLGMPDGGIVVSPLSGKIADLPYDKSFDRCSQLLKRLELSPSEGYADYKANGKKNIDTPLSRMSVISESILRSVDLDKIKDKRRSNFAFLHNSLVGTNNLSIPSLEEFEAPLVYPYWSNNSSLKQKLIKNQVFVATYWPNVFEWCAETELEYVLASNIICIPCDQRYTEEDMKRIIAIIQS